MSRKKSPRYGVFSQALRGEPDRKLYPCPLSAKIRSMARSAKTGIHWVIRVSVEKIREEVWY
jgi:hypothetical protein